jgi:hypothetical protein
MECPEVEITDEGETVREDANTVKLKRAERASGALS